MKLTKTDKDAFVVAVMNDVPSVDYTSQARVLVTADAASKLPKNVRAIWDNNETRGFIRCDIYFRAAGFNTSFSIPYVDYAPSVAMAKKLQGLADKNQAQRKQRDDLRDKVNAVISGCTTLKQALDRLPEFAKYLPTERGTTGVSGLPAIANVVADLSKAGWPKDRTKATGA